MTIADSVTGLSSTATARVLVAPDSATPPVVTLTALPTSGAAPLTTDLEITGSDPNGLPLTYSLAFGDGSSTATGSLSGTADVSHTYEAAGSYDAVVNVSDGELTELSQCRSLWRLRPLLRRIWAIPRW